MSRIKVDSDDIAIVTLAREEALILYDALLQKIDEQDDWDPLDPVDCALNGLYCELERALPEVAEPGFSERLRHARNAIIAFYADASAEEEGEGDAAEGAPREEAPASAAEPGG